MRGNNFCLGRGVVSLVIVFSLVLGALGEAKAAPYYQGKVILFVAPTNAGAGTDIWGRMIARHFGKFIPGNPKIVIRNMPGATGLICANYAFAAKPDGLTILLSDGSTVTQNITRPKGTVFRMEQMHPIYAQPEGCVYYIKPGLIKEPKDILTAKGLIFGHRAATGGVSGPFLLAKEILGFECKMVLGYEGSGPARLAFLSGESNVTGGGTAGHNAMKPYMERGQAVTLFQTGLLGAGGNIVGEKAAPNIPTMPEFYQQIYGKAPSGPFFEVYKLLLGTRTFSQTILLPPKTPAEVVNICRKAVMDMVRDPKFLEDAETVLPGGVHFFGEDLVRIFPGGVSGNPETVKFYKSFFADKYGVVFD